MGDSQIDMHAKTLQTVGAVAKLPIVRVDREAFLRKHFADSAHLDVILESGPPAVYSTDSLRDMARSIVRTSAAKSSAASFASGFAGNPVIMVAAGGADVAQFFGFAINLAQQIAYLFGEDQLFDDGVGQLSEEAQIRVIAYLGAMLGAAGAVGLVAKTSQAAGATVGKRVAAHALTKTAWYPLVKRVGALVGQQITKKTVEKTITKAVPVVGGLVSGGITFVTFRPMGYRLVDVLAKNLEGDYAHDLVVNAAFAAALDANGRA